MKKTSVLLLLLAFPVQVHSWVKIAEDDVYLFRGHTKYQQKDIKRATLDYDRFMQRNPQTVSYPLRDRPSYFLRPPELLGAETTFNETGVRNPTYFYYVKVPHGMGGGIKTIEILQEEGGEGIDYNPNRIDIKGINNIPFSSQLEDRKLILNFKEPIVQGQTITIAISPYQNPNLSGTYQFRVTAFPDGELPRGQFLGYGRFNFDRPFR